MSERTCRKFSGAAMKFAGVSARQRGRAVLLVLVALVAVAAIAIFFKERSRAVAKAQRDGGVVVAQRAEAAPDVQAAAKRERVALEEQARQAEKVQEDVLAQSLRRFDDAMQRWDDAGRVAGSVSRIALAQPVAVLQALHRETEQLQAPPCLESGKEVLVLAMKETLEGYLAFMVNSDKLGTFAAQRHFDYAEPLFAKYREVRAACPNPA